MKYIDYGTMQNDAQRRVLDMQRRAREAVCSRLPENVCAPAYAPEAHVASEPQKSAAEKTFSEAAKEPIRDPEEMLITAVLALLLAEKADAFLILALLYLLM